MTDKTIQRNPLSKSVLRILEESASFIGRSEADVADSEMWNVFRDAPITSPIEQLFYCGLCAVARVNGFRVVPVVGSPFPFPSPKINQAHSEVLCYPQAAVGRYRADFIIYFLDGPAPMPTVVELDGHQWHDRDEKQRRYEKRRDRYMQAQGFRVARFTGSEVARDPYRVAADAMDLVVMAGDHFLTPEEYWGE